MQLRSAIAWTAARGYDRPLPFHPPERYPELAFLPAETDPENHVYAGVRALLAGLGYDAARRGTPAWSPLSDLVRPGGTVVIKPNYVRHYHERGGPFGAVVTHAAVLRPLVDYALLAVGPGGRVVVADAPQYDCDVDRLLARTRLPELLAWYQGALGRDVAWRDLRVQFGRHERGVVVERRALPGDPEGYEPVDLGDASEFASMALREQELLRGADYDEEVTIRHHSHGRNEYLVSKTVLGADLVINVPKVKSHKKTGVTLSMKNLIGINGDKNWLPHFRAGFAVGGGDEFPAPDAYARLRRVGGEVARRLLKRGIGGAVFKRLRGLEDAAGLGERARNGNWWGNDTIWRTTIDLNKILYCGDARGALGGSPARRVLNVYDGVVAGEGDGPMAPSPRPEGLLAAGEDGVATDVVVAWLMGFDWRRIPVLARALGELAGGVRITRFEGDPAALPVVEIDERGTRETRLADLSTNLRFEAHPGWKGRIEREVHERDPIACAS
ncbi:MAG: hypothetical protein DCC71_13960 [Proteobacteria bacterium]|nr:MAG: hypothetical protein DCC71_13960 [Pseudomonadota bacterium]